jgi:hypothetical protein
MNTLIGAGITREIAVKLFAGRLLALDSLFCSGKISLHTDIMI